MLDAVSTSLMLADDEKSLHQLTRLSKSLNDLLTELTGPNAIKELLVILSSRILTKIRKMLKRDTLRNLVNEENYFDFIGYSKESV